MSKAQIEFRLKMVKNALLPDGTSVYDLMLRPNIGQEEARMAFEAAIKNDPETPRIALKVVRVFAETHGYDSDEAFYAALNRIVDAVLAEWPGIRKH